MSKSVWFILVIMLVPLIGFLVYVNTPPANYPTPGGPTFPKSEPMSAPLSPPRPAPAMRAAPPPIRAKPAAKPVSSLQFIRTGKDLFGPAPAKTLKPKPKKKSMKKRASTTTTSTLPQKKLIIPSN